MDPSGIADRRRLRRKLTFWRVAAALALVGLVAGRAYMGGLTGERATARPHIARVEISGVITADEELLERLDEIRRDDSVKGLIVAIESPGGTTYGGERLYDAVRAIADVKPVAAEVRGLAASAGYMVALATDHIVAGEASIVGSIGVLFQYGNVAELLDNLGISVDAVKSSPLKASPSPFEPADPRAAAMIRRLVEDSYEWFLAMVVERRGFSREEALAVSDGSIYTGRQALENGLIDELGAEPEVLAFFAERGLGDDLKVIEWEDEDRGGFLFGRAMGELLVGAVAEAFDFAKPLEELSGGKFLDGLVSVWQFGGGQARDD